MNSEAEELLTSDAEETTPERMQLVVDIRNVGPCRKHVSVTVPEPDIAAVREDCLEELMSRAQVPGFRVGRAPRELLLKRFREDIVAQVKQKVLMASLDQISRESSIDPINEPRIDVESLEIPDAGDFHYEFEVEVRPEFDLPDFSSFSIRRPVGEVTAEEFAAYRERFIADYAKLNSVTEPAGPGDHVVCSMTFRHDGRVISELENANIQLRPNLVFQDAVLEGFESLLTGISGGGAVDTKIRISMQSQVIEMRGEEVDVHIAVADVQQRALPEIDKEFLSEVQLESAEQLDQKLRESLERQVEYQQRQSARKQVQEQILESAKWDLPENLVRQQTENAMRRELLEMSQAGFTQDEILARENDLRRNAIDSTRQALKEHFILDRVATREGIECRPEDVDREILMMSFQSGEPVRRIRARLTKSGTIENLKAQLRERKAVDFILSKATFQDVPRAPSVKTDTVGIRYAVCGRLNATLIDDSAPESGAPE